MENFGLAIADATQGLEIDPKQTKVPGALSILTCAFPDPKCDGQCFFRRGVAQEGLGKWKEAMNNFKEVFAPANPGSLRADGPSDDWTGPKDRQE